MIIVIEEKDSALMGKRIKEIREKKNMIQADFAKLLGIGQSTLAMLEVSKRKISERHIKTICSICSVNEDWFRTGKGAMFIDKQKPILNKLIDELNLDKQEIEILNIYLSLSKEQRKSILNFIFEFSKKINEIS
jgi:transcriptional regulator with XRE-family HTH domain